MDEHKVAQVASVIAAAYAAKPGYALLFATTQIIQCLASDDDDGFSLWQRVGMTVANMEMMTFNAR